MSRIPHNDLWASRHGKALIAKCPCCTVRYIHRDKLDGKRDWKRGHIIPHWKDGPDIYENLQPLCRVCNDKDKEFASTYHYMALELKIISVREADLLVAGIWEAFDRRRQHPEITHCLAFVGNTLTRCTNKRKPDSHFCGVHGKRADDHLNRYVDVLADREVAALRESRKRAEKDGDQEAVVVINEVIGDYVRLKRRCV